MADFDLPFPEARGPDVDAENDPSILDLETICASCGLPHHKPGLTRDCPCARHIDVPGTTSCNAARLTPAGRGLSVEEKA